MSNKKKIIGKIYKCLRLSESGNPNEAALALRQANSLMKKHGISDAQVMAAEVSESTTPAGERYNPQSWALALANLIAEAFECRNLISRQFGRRPKFHFIGFGFKAEVATYSYTVLHRHLSLAIEEFQLSVEGCDSEKGEGEEMRRIEVFTQAWIFRVGSTVSDFIGENKDKEVIDEYIKEKYGEAVDLPNEAIETAETKGADYDDILSGMKAANEVELFRSVGRHVKPQLLRHKQAS